MPICKEINGLRLDSESRQAIANLGNKKKLYKYLSVSLVGGTLVDILSGRTQAARMMSIKMTDFQALHSALNGAASMFKHDLMRTAQLQVIGRAKNNQNKTFWENVFYGCQK